MQQTKILKVLASLMASGEGSMLRNRICDPYASVLIKVAMPGRANCVTENIDMKNQGESTR